jgi:hypothetical protein
VNTTIHRPLAALFLLGAAAATSPARAETFVCGDGAGCPTAIPDPGSASSSIDVLSATCPFGLPVVDLTVDVHVLHQWTGDLTITLEHESGARAVLFRRPLIDQVAGGCAGDDIDATYASSVSGARAARPSLRRRARCRRSTTSTPSTACRATCCGP